MAIKRQCDRCKEYFDVKGVKQLDYYESGLGHYYTLHLCGKCHKEFQQKFMKELSV